MKRLLLNIHFILFALVSYSQSGGVSISPNNTSADPSAMLDVNSSSKGLLIPRMTTAERNAIISPAFGLMIFNTSTACFNMWTGTSWKQWCGECDFTAPVVGNNSPICEGATLNLNSSNMPGGATFLWSGPNGFVSTLQNPGIAGVTTSAGGSYSLVVTYNGCTSNPVSTVATVNPIPQTPVATASPNPVCEGSALTLSATTIIGANYNWTGPNSYTANTQSPTVSNIQTNQAGTYNVIASVNGCSSAAGSVSVTVNTNPSSAFTPLTGTQNIPVSFAPTVTGAAYSWSFSSGLPSISTLQNPTITWTTAGSYSVSLTVTQNGCSSSTTSNIIINSINFGTGNDGSVTISSSKNINTSVIASGRTCADGVSYSVTGLTPNTATLSSAPNTGCLAQGDEVLLISLQGTSSNFSNVGNYETLIVQSVAGNVVTFSYNKAKFYGDGASDDNNIGTSSSNQRVLLQRVPNYANVTIDGSGTLTANAWDGTIGGVLFFRASGTVTHQGLIDMRGSGYRGGIANWDPFQGESRPRVGIQSTSANDGGGGGAGNCAGGGSGGGYATGGSIGMGSCGTVGGGIYGAQTLTSLFLGSGGGSSHNNNSGNYTGGMGGGIISITANTINITGSVNSNGTTPGGCNTGSFSYGPGGGSGGSIYLAAKFVTLGSSLVTNNGAVGASCQYNGGTGGEGRIAVYYSSTISGSTTPSAYTQQVP